jgi:hypothetical protein
VAVDPAWLTWNDGIVVRLAQAASVHRQEPGNALDSGRLAVLADALEGAGCSSGDVLNHLRGRDTCGSCHGSGEAEEMHQGMPVWRPCSRCRGTGRLPPTPGHCYGYWVLDLLLGTVANRGREV